MKNIKMSLGARIAACILAMQVVVMSGMVLLVGNAITKQTKESAIGNMQTVVQERSQIIENHVVETEKLITAYARAGEVRALLSAPDNAAAQAAAQAYTENFSADLSNLEGVYIADWNTHVLAHTNAAVVGITTREGEALKTLQDAMLAADGVYNLGIMISPASGRQSVSVYMPLFAEGGEPMGYVGGGVFTADLVRLLDSLSMKGMENAQYCMVNLKDKKYIFCPDEEQVAQEATEPYIAELCGRYAGQTQDDAGFVEYEADGQKNIATYYYMANRGWLFIVSDSTKEIFSETDHLKRVMTAFAVVALLVLVGLSALVIRVLMQPLGAIKESLVSLQNFNIADNPKIHKFTERGDELGSIAAATDGLIHSLQAISDTLNDCSSSLNEKAGMMSESSRSLADGTVDNIAVTQELSASMENTISLVTNIQGEIASINKLVGVMVSGIEASVETSSGVIGSAKDMKGTADFAYKNGEVKLQETRVAIQEAIEKLKSLTKINELASEILSIAGKTNLLSLNASIEAARAGEAGKGFAVVAGSIANLAETSKSTASSIQDICGEANNSIAIVNSCFDSVISFIEQDVVVRFKDFAEKSTEYSEAVAIIKGKMDEMLGAVRRLEESVAQISENVGDVGSIMGENQTAIGVIVEKNETTAAIAGTTQDQSQENREMADHLGEIVGKFHR